ncbi:hypothetical protein QQZ08_009376 [Neonectria magnoliae]|uniref:Uncharacterized protein n=1 Tax=Neonectria magnoliae TaxID=2732573 RepID=A0ABR1HP58_9HYPO
MIPAFGNTSSDDNSSFYVLNADILAVGNAVLNTIGGSVEDVGQGSDRVFAYENSTIRIIGTKINVEGGSSGGIEVTGGGSLGLDD